MCSGSEAGSYLRLIDSCITQLKAQGLSRTCNESKEEEEKKFGGSLGVGGVDEERDGVRGWMHHFGDPRRHQPHLLSVHFLFIFVYTFLIYLRIRTFLVYLRILKYTR